MVRRFVLLPLAALMGAALILSSSPRALAQSGPMTQSREAMDDMARLAIDLHAGVGRSTLTEAQKKQFREDFRQLKEARQNHEMIAEIRAYGKIRATLDSGAFKPADRKKIKQDLEAVHKAREAEHRARL
jgi:Spy/CpxP family protein refolding chaperone